MSSRHRLLSVFVALLAAAWLWHAWSQGQADARLAGLTPDKDATPTEQGQVVHAEAQASRNQLEALHARPGSKSMASIIERHTTLSAALQEAMALRGTSDPDIVSAVLDAVGICQELPEESALSDPDSGLMAGHEDKAKISAISRLEAWCEGFDADAMMKQLGTSQADVLAAAQSGTTQQQLDHAREHLRSEIAFERLVAGRRMIDAGLLSVAGPDGRAQLSKHEMYLAWWMSSMLAGCQRGLGCEPNSPTTLSFCAEAGCAPGLVLDQAVRRSVPPRMYAGVMFFSRWNSNPR